MKITDFNKMTETDDIEEITEYYKTDDISYEKRFKDKIKGIKTSELRLSSLEKMLSANDFEMRKYYIDLTERLFNEENLRLFYKKVEKPLEIISSDVLATTPQDEYFRRKDYDGQLRKRKDGTEYQRKFNTVTESDCTTYDDYGNEISPLGMAGTYDRYFDSIDNVIEDIGNEIPLSDIEKTVLLMMYDNKTINFISEETTLSRRQIEVVRNHLRYKVLYYLSQSYNRDDYFQYLLKCSGKYKDFTKKYESYIAKM